MATNNDKTKVTRISASDDKTPKQTPKVSKAKTRKQPNVKSSNVKRSYGILGRFLGYFKGAWQELRQVHWPTRGATWGLTGAVLIFTVFFVLFITTLDAAFKFIFEQILQ